MQMKLFEILVEIFKVGIFEFGISKSRISMSGFISGFLALVILYNRGFQIAKFSGFQISHQVEIFYIRDF